MKKKDNIFILLVVLTAVVVLLVAYLYLDSRDSGEPAHIRLKNLLHGARYSDSVASREARDTYRTLNRADASPLPLMQGSCGFQVELVQRLLNRHCRTRLVEDGYWGPVMERAIGRYYTNASGYRPPLYNRFFSYAGTSYRVTEQQLLDLVASLGPSLC